MAITQIPVRGKITIRNFSIETPYLLSFNVTKSRGAASTFNASVKIKGNDVHKLSGSITISAGVKNSLNKIFTGYIRKVRPSPCWDDPEYLIVNIEGADALYKLENRRFTRRQVYSDNSWTTITSATPGMRTGRAKLTNVPTLIVNGGESIAAGESNNASQGTGPSSFGDISLAPLSMGKEKQQDIEVNITKVDTSNN